MIASNLAQLKLDQKNNGWPYKIDHPNDERALLDGCYLDWEAARRVRDWYSTLYRIPDQINGGTKPFEMLDWWFRDVFAPIFGWKKPDGRRRFDRCFITTAKKSGKSSMLAGLPAYMMLCDGVEEAECYATAVDRDQASIIYTKASRMVKLSPELSKIIKSVDSQKRLVHHGSGSWFEAISSDADSAEGLNPLLLICDELHAWKTAKAKEFYYSLMYGDIMREQPLRVIITTAGDDPESVGYKEYEAAKMLADPNNEVYSQGEFVCIREAEGDTDEIWDKPESWIAANPSLLEGLGSVEKLKSRCADVRRKPTEKRKFIRYIVNRWLTEAEEPWLEMELWDACSGEIRDHSGERCWIGIDLSLTQDITALCRAWWDEDVIDLEWDFWVPEDGVKAKEDEWRVPLRDWIATGYIRTTPGRHVNYEYIKEQLLKDRQRYDIKEVPCDKWNATHFISDLEEKHNMPIFEHDQTVAKMNSPCKEFERRVGEKRLRHGNNPVANWMARNVVTYTDINNNIKLDRKKSRHKIDGMVAAVMALGRAFVAHDTAYSKGGGVVLL